MQTRFSIVYNHFLFIKKEKTQNEQYSQIVSGEDIQTRYVMLLKNEYFECDVSCPMERVEHKLFFHKQ